MALRFDFKPGPQQSVEATRYFMLLGAELLQAYLPPLDPKQLLLTENGHPPLALRIWSEHHLSQERMTDLLPWIRALAEGMDKLSRHPGDLEEAQYLTRMWMSSRHREETFFIEKLNRAHAFTTDEDVELSIGVVGGETVMLSARNVMFMKIGQGLFGLSLARTGSYVVEQVGAREPMPVHARRA
ncbi:MAG TPA: hypothetical protein VKG92_05510 [Flavobacteriales bacterium]|nr:hypothetical protein [Flavobacteriales bacterium]